jgi:hypothetical protein
VKQIGGESVYHKNFFEKIKEEIGFFLLVNILFFPFTMLHMTVWAIILEKFNIDISAIICPILMPLPYFAQIILFYSIFFLIGMVSNYAIITLIGLWGQWQWNKLSDEEKERQLKQADAESYRSRRAF